MAKFRQVSIDFNEIEKASSRYDRPIVIIAALLTLFMHLGAFFIFNYISNQHVIEKEKVFDLVLNEEVEVAKYLKTNPNVDLQESVDTNNIAARSQIAEQTLEHNDSDVSDTPNVQGEFEDINAFIPEEISEPLESEFSEESMTSEEPKKEVVSEEITEDLAIESAPKEVVEAEKEKELAEPKPLPRPKLSDVLNTALSKQTTNARLGRSITVSAKFSEYGAYLERLLEVIKYQWYMLIQNTGYTQEDSSTQVAVSFKINKDGVINDVAILASTASSLASMACADSIASIERFDAWTEEMIEILEEEEEIKIVFRYL